MNDKQLDALLEQMKNTPLPEQERVSDEELLQSFRRRRTHDRKSMIKRVAAVMLLASLAYCFYVSYEAIVAHNALKQWNAPEKWYFLPCFDKDVRGVEIPSNGDGHFYDAIPEPIQKLLSPESGLTEQQRDEMHWRVATFPHTDFVKLMPKNNMFGWYGCEFDMPAELKGMDVLADLGIIDDADETFVNGSLVAHTGKIPGGSAWQTDRLYRIPAQKLTPSRNFLAVHVWSLWGFGGIAGPPIMKAALCPPDAKWEVSFVHDNSVPKAGLNSAKTFGKALALFENADSLKWQSSAMPWKEFANWEEKQHYAVFKVAFDLKDGDAPRRLDYPSIMDMGPVFDVAAIFLNGKRLCLTGRFPENGNAAFTEAAQRVRFIVPPDAWSRDGRNELAAIVYRERGTGGLPSLPGILLENPLEQEEPSFAQLSDSYYILMQSGDRKAAKKLLGKMRPENDGEKAWLLSHHAHLSFIEWLDGGAMDVKLLEGTIAPVAEILEKMPMVSPKQSAMQAFCRVLRMAERDADVMKMVKRHLPSFKGSVKYLGEDSVTKGDWPFHYGMNGCALAAMSYSFGAQFKLRLPVDYDTPRYYYDPSKIAVAAPDALLAPTGAMEEFATMSRVDYMSLGQHFASGKKLRRALWWDDHGEMHPFDDNGPDLLLDWLGTSDRRRVALYLLDYDWRNTLHPRQQSIIVYDSDGKFQDALWLGKLCGGTYRLFETTSEKTTFRVNKHRSASSCILGCFCDKAEFGDIPDSLPPHVASLLRGILEIERRHAAHSEFDNLHDSFRSISSVKEAVAFAYALRNMGIETPRWRMMLFARLFELLDGMEDEELLLAAKSIADNFNIRIGADFISDVVLMNYLQKRGVPADAPICKELKHRLPNWSKSKITIK